MFVIFGVLLKHRLGPTFLVGPLNDWFPMMNLVLFGFSNGYCLTLLAIKAPSKAPLDHKDSVGIFVGIFITLGIVLGSAISIPVNLIK